MIFYAGKDSDVGEEEVIRKAEDQDLSLVDVSIACWDLTLALT